MQKTFITLKNLKEEERIAYEKELQKNYTEGVNGFVFQKPLKEFNKDGLKYSLDHLTILGKSIIMLPVEWMQKYVDKVAFNMVNNEHPKLIANILNHEEFIYETVNATTIGNLAYILLHVNDKKVEEICTNYLHEIFTKYYEEVQSIEQTLN